MSKPFANDSSATPDPFDVASLRLSGDFTAATGVKKALITVPVRKPDKAWFVRVRPGDEHSLNVFVIELKEDREMYLVHSSLAPELAGETTLKPMALFTAVNRQDVVFIWPVRLPDQNGKTDEWARSAHESAKLAERSWVRFQSNTSLGAYECYTANGNLPEPIWPDSSFQDLLRIAFKDKLINSLDHPVLRKLRGEL